MSWNILTGLLNEIHNHSTFVGKVWLNLFTVFRIVLTVVGGESIYYDEQSKFVCNTAQPGCENVCYNSFAPISHVRFWVFQIILVSTPSFMYLCYAVHKTARAEERANGGEGRRLPRKKPKMYYLTGKKHHRGIEEAEDTPEEDPAFYKMVEMVSDGENAAKQHGDEERVKVKARHDGYKRIKEDGLMPFYMLQLLVCLLLEVAFLCGQYFLFGFAVPPTYLCSELPCPHRVDCFVSRPTEKTIFLRIMYAVSFLCLALNIWEILALAIGSICERVHAREPQPPQDKSNITVTPVEASTKDHDKPPPDLANAKVTHPQCVMIIIQDSDYFGREGTGDEPAKYRVVKWV